MVMGGGGSLAHMQIRDTYAWMITEIREYMHECKHMDTDRLFPYVRREDTHSPTHTSLKLCLICCICCIRQNRPVSFSSWSAAKTTVYLTSLMDRHLHWWWHTHTLTHTWTCLGALLDTHREHCRALHNLLRLGKTKDRKRKKKKIHEHDFKTAYILS